MIKKVVKKPQEKDGLNMGKVAEKSNAKKLPKILTEAHLETLADTPGDQKGLRKRQEKSVRMTSVMEQISNF